MESLSQSTFNITYPLNTPQTNHKTSRHKEKTFVDYPNTEGATQNTTQNKSKHPNNTANEYTPTNLQIYNNTQNKIKKNTPQLTPTIIRTTNTNKTNTSNHK